LYFPNATATGPAEVVVCKDGTRVLRDITEAVHFQHSPWTDGLLEGVIDFPALNLAPGTRSGIVPDDCLMALVGGVAELEPEVLRAIEERNQAESERASRDILRQVHKALVNALRQLPAEEYLFFDIPQTPAPAGKNGKPAPPDPDLMTESPDAGDGPADQIREERPVFLPLDPGVLTSVRITPRHPRCRPGSSCQLTATATDECRMNLNEQTAFAWRIAEGQASLTAASHVAQVQAEDESQTTVEVTARLGDVEVSDSVVVKFLDGTNSDDGDQAKGLPTYRLEAEHRQQWRSLYQASANEIVINSAHRDFVASRSTPAKHRRYIGKLYAKEMVLLNFPHEPPSEVMERLVELLLRTEDAL
jgi:hypothetical protein